MIEPRAFVNEIEEYKPPLKGRRGFLRLDFNENTLGCSPMVMEAIKNISEEEIAAYPEYNNFKGKLASLLGVSQNNILITNATDEAIMLVMQTYVEPKDEVIIPTPTFVMFRFYANLVQAKIKEVLYTRNLLFPAKKVLNAITKKTRLLVLCNPNNPTGTSIKEKDLLKILEKSNKNRVIVLLDEAYVQFTGKSYISLIKGFDNLFVLQTFSKAYGLGGLRIGYMVSDSRNIESISKIKSPYSVSSVAIAAASKAIEDLEYVNWYVSEIKKAKKILYDGLKRLGVRYYPSDANFLIVKFGKDCVSIKNKLREKGILVRDRSSYPLLQGCLRVGIGTVKQTKKFLSVLEEIING